MGAGLSGLSCAITLEQNGISPTIFEKRNQIGDRFVNGEILLSIMSRPIKDDIAYLSQKHGIFLRPTGNINKFILHSENETGVITGNLGFTNIRGRDKDSFECQLAQQVKSKIFFNSKQTYEHLLKDFSHVILATGDGSYATKIQPYEQDLTVSLKGFTIVGDFNRYTIEAWLNNDIAPKGYSYLIPLSEKEANIVVAYPDYPENSTVEIGDKLDILHSLVCKNLDQDLKITDSFQIKNYIIGKCHSPRIGNTLFVGNCFGSIMPFLGFGQMSAILTGVYAAYDLLGKGQYEDLTKRLRSSYNNSLVIRRSMEKLDNSKFDLLVKGLNGPLGNKLFTASRVDFLKAASYLLRPLVAVTKG